VPESLVCQHPKGGPEGARHAVPSNPSLSAKIKTPEVTGLAEAVLGLRHDGRGITPVGYQAGLRYISAWYDGESDGV
jgi:hypothetical protein